MTSQTALEKKVKELSELVESMGQTNNALSKKASEIQAKYDKCIVVIKRFDAGIIGMYDL
mgnify:CR=1 FL=1